MKNKIECEINNAREWPAGNNDWKSSDKWRIGWVIQAGDC